MKGNKMLELNWHWMNAFKFTVFIKFPMNLMTIIGKTTLFFKIYGCTLQISTN